MYVYVIQIFLADGLTNGRTEVFHEALADLKKVKSGKVPSQVSSNLLEKVGQLVVV